jgi:hypothetical protein
MNAIAATPITEENKENFAFSRHCLGSKQKKSIHPPIDLFSRIGGVKRTF